MEEGVEPGGDWGAVSGFSREGAASPEIGQTPIADAGLDESKDVWDPVEEASLMVVAAGQLDTHSALVEELRARRTYAPRMTHVDLDLTRSPDLKAPPTSSWQRRPQNSVSAARSPIACANA
jgi:hypothetical protein